MTTAKDYRNDIRPNWCPGCGHYGVQAAITDAVVAKIFHLKNWQLSLVSVVLAVSVVISMHMVHIQLMVVRFHTLKALNLLTKT